MLAGYVTQSEVANAALSILAFYLVTSVSNKFLWMQKDLQPGPVKWDYFCNKSFRQCPAVRASTGKYCLLSLGIGSMSYVETIFRDSLVI